MTVTVIHKNPICSFNANWFVDIIDQYLHFEPWDQTRTYPRGTLFYLNLLDFGNPAGHEFCAELVDRGFRVIIDNLWDAETIRRTEHNHNHMFDRGLVERRFTAEIINPVMEFVCRP